MTHKKPIKTLKKQSLPLEKTKKTIFLWCIWLSEILDSLKKLSNKKAYRTCSSLL